MFAAMRNRKHDSKRATQITPSDAEEPRLRCRGFVLEVGHEGLSGDEAIALAERVERETVGTDWRVEPFGRTERGSPGTQSAHREFALRRADGADVPVADAWDIVRMIRAHRSVSCAEPSFDHAGLAPPPDGLDRWLTANERHKIKKGILAQKRTAAVPSKDWSVRAVRADAAWERMRRAGHAAPGRGIVIGHPDTGYSRHPAIWSGERGRMRIGNGYDFLDRHRDPTDPLNEAPEFPGHGTATAGVMIGGGDSGVSGIAPFAEVVPFRVSRTAFHLGFEEVACAIEHAVAVGCHVIALCLGGPVRSAFLHRAVRRAVDAGVIVVAASGDYWPWVVYPARFDEVIAVTAMNSRDRVWRFATSGSSVDLAAPGEDVWVASAKPGGSFGTEPASGTSFAAAAVAAAAALWLDYHGRRALLARYGTKRLPIVFKESLVHSGVRTPKRWDTKRHGAGILDIERLLAAELPDAAPARGFAATRPSERPRVVSDIEELHRLAPGGASAVTRSRIARLLNVRDAELATALAPHADEIAFHLMTSPVWREVIAARPLAGVRGNVPRLDAFAERVNPFERLAQIATVSKTLRGAILGT